MPESCKEDVRALDGLYVPTFEDLERMPCKELPSEENMARLRNLAKVVQQIVEERREIALAALSYEETLRLLVTLYCNLENILRASEDEPAPRHAGYGIYPTFAHVERHLTDFNCEFYFDINANVVVRAAQALDGDTPIIAPPLPIDLSIADPEQFKALMDRLLGTAVTPPADLLPPPLVTVPSQSKKR